MSHLLVFSNSFAASDMLISLSTIRVNSVNFTENTIGFLVRSTAAVENISYNSLRMHKSKRFKSERNLAVFNRLYLSFSLCLFSSNLFALAQRSSRRITNDRPIEQIDARIVAHLTNAFTPSSSIYTNKFIYRNKIDYYRKCENDKFILDFRDDNNYDKQKRSEWNFQKKLE